MTKKKLELMKCKKGDTATKDVMDLMEMPYFKLSKNIEYETWEYSHNGTDIRITPGNHGLPTMYDKDIIVYCISQIVNTINMGGQPSRRIKMKAIDLLKCIGKSDCGFNYSNLKKSIQRLRRTTVERSGDIDGKRFEEEFQLIERYRIIRKKNDMERMESIEIVLSEWMYDRMIDMKVLTLNNEYYNLKKPLEKQTYLIARKHCGSSLEWIINIMLLKEKTGSSSQDKEFTRSIKAIASKDTLPDYHTKMIEDKRVKFSRRGSQVISELPLLSTNTYDRAKLTATGLDVYRLEVEWREQWNKSGRKHLRDPESAFVGYCKKRAISQML